MHSLAQWKSAISKNKISPTWPPDIKSRAAISQTLRMVQRTFEARMASEAFPPEAPERSNSGLNFPTNVAGIWESKKWEERDKVGVVNLSTLALPGMSPSSLEVTKMMCTRNMEPANILQLLFKICIQCNFAKLQRCYRDSSDVHNLLHFETTLARREGKEYFLYVDFARA